LVLVLVYETKQLITKYRISSFPYCFEKEFFLLGSFGAEYFKASLDSKEPLNIEANNQKI
jgi:hypothetical protein